MLVSKFCNAKAIYLLGYLFMIAWLGSWRLRGRKNVSVGHETSIPSIQKVSASSFSSRGLFFSSIWTVRPRYARSDNCPISEKKSPLSEKEVGTWPFSLGDILVSGPTEHLFWQPTAFLGTAFWSHLLVVSCITHFVGLLKILSLIMLCDNLQY